MVRTSLVLIGIFTAPIAFPCQYPSEAAHAAAREAAERRVAKSVVELVDVATAIYVARVTAVSPNGDRASFQIVRVIKGTLPDGQRLELPLTQEFTVNSCDFGASLFFTVRAAIDADHILYFVGGHAKRGVPRTQAEESFVEELRLIDAAMPPNKSLERTRAK